MTGSFTAIMMNIAIMRINLKIIETRSFHFLVIFFCIQTVMKITELVNMLKQYVKSCKVQGHKWLENVRIIYSSTVKHVNAKTYDVIPLEIWINFEPPKDTYKGFQPVFKIMTFDEIVTLFDGKIPYIRVVNTVKDKRGIKPDGFTILGINCTPKKSSSGVLYYDHATGVVKKAENIEHFNELDKEVTEKVRQMKEEYQNQLRKQDTLLQELMDGEADI